MLVKRSVQQDSKILTQLEQSFKSRTGQRKGTPKGVDETHFCEMALTTSIEYHRPTN